MKKTLSQRFFLPLCLLTLFGILGGNHAWAAVGDVFYTLNCPKSTSNNAYATYYNVSISGITWNAPGNQSLGNYWRIGGKRLSSVDRTITAKNAMGSAISKVTLNHNGISNANLKVNSISLTIASDADFTTNVETVTITSPSISVSTAGSFDFTPDGGSWAKDSYYQLTINVTNTVGKNYGLDITSLVFYEGESAASKISFPENSDKEMYADEIASFVSPVLQGAESTDVITYVSSNEALATVASDGTVSIAEGVIGTAKITATGVDASSVSIGSDSYTISVWPNSISGLKPLITSTSEIDFKVKLNNAIITYADTKNAYLQDADAAILIYIKEGHTMTAGQSYTGVASGKATLYNGLREITSINWGTITPETVGVPAAETVTLAELNADYDKYESMYVYVQNAIVSSALTSKNATISQGSEEYNVYDKNNGLGSTALSTTNAIANFYGFPSVYNTTHQLNVFNDIDVEETGYNLAVSAAGYATYFNSTEAYTMPTGATGYVWDEGNIAAVYNPAQVVPANEPLVIKAAAGNYPLWFTTSTEETYKSYGYNDLEGTDVETPITDDDAYYFYGLSLNKSSEAGSVGFYWMNVTGAAFTNGAHKAYLKLAKSVFAGSQAVNGFPFNGSTTGIEQIEAGADAKNAIYDLSGRRVNKAAKGIYILNGKKVLVK